MELIVSQNMLFLNSYARGLILAVRLFLVGLDRVESGWDVGQAQDWHIDQSVTEIPMPDRHCYNDK